MYIHGKGFFDLNLGRSHVCLLHCGRKVGRDPQGSYIWAGEVTTEALAQVTCQWWLGFSQVKFFSWGVQQDGRSHLGHSDRLLRELIALHCPFTV